MHLYNLDDWMGVSSVLKEMRLVKVDLAADTIEELTIKGQEFDKNRFNFKLRDRELYTDLWERLNKKLKATMIRSKEGVSKCSVGFHSISLVTKSTKHSLRFADTTQWATSSTMPLRKRPPPSQREGRAPSAQPRLRRTPTARQPRPPPGRLLGLRGLFLPPPGTLADWQSSRLDGDKTGRVQGNVHRRPRESLSSSRGPSLWLCAR